MILDKQLAFSDSPQAVTAAAISENVYDRVTANDDIVGGTPMCLVMHVTGAAALNPTTSLTVTFESAENAGLSTNAVVHLTRTILTAALTAGSTHEIGVVNAPATKRYLGVRYTPDGGDATTGSVETYLVAQAQQNPIV